jgi:hypothetical protein
MRLAGLLLWHAFAFIWWLFTLAIVPAPRSFRRERKPYPRQDLADVVPFTRTARRSR